MSAVYFTASVLPKPGQTVVRVAPQRTTEYTWTDQQETTEITTLVIGGLTIQFDTPTAALAWLDDCRTEIKAQVTATARRRGAARAVGRARAAAEAAKTVRVDAARPHCQASEPEFGFICNEPEGHVGDHVNAGPEVEYARWPR